MFFYLSLLVLQFKIESTIEFQLEVVLLSARACKFENNVQPISRAENEAKFALLRKNLTLSSALHFAS